MKPRVLLFVPVYNEQNQIGGVLEKCRRLISQGSVDQVVVVDDGSTDRSPEIIRSFPEITCIRHAQRREAGETIRTAYRHALANNFEIVALLAGNGKDNPAEVPRLLEPILRGEADYVQGSRFLKGGYSRGLPAHRLWAMRAFTWTFSLFLMRHLTDCTNGFRAYRTEILRDRRLDWAQEWLGQSYEIEFYMHYKAAALGYRVKEVPVSKIYRPAADGTYSKVRLRDWLTNLKPLFLLRFGIKQ
jgi:dolichol-phosphate mannosyltransferase